MLGLIWKNVNLDAGTIKLEQRVWHQDVGRPKSEDSKRVLGIGDLVERLRTKALEDGATPHISCGLSLVHPCESGELGVTEHGRDEDIRQNWFIIHTASGKGFGRKLNFKRATDALLLAASFAVDWTQDADSLRVNPKFRRVGYTVQAAFSCEYEKESAKQKLADLERSA